MRKMFAPFHVLAKLFMERRNQLTILSGIMLFMSFPPFGLGFIIFFALIPFLFAVRDLYWLDAFRQGFLISSIFFIGLIYWIFPITTGGFLGTIVAMGIYFGVVMILLKLIRDRLGWIGWLAFPFLFSSMEWIRSLGLLGFPWGNVGYALGDYNTLIQIVSITGVGGLSFWILTVNVLGFLAIEKTILVKVNSTKLYNIPPNEFSSIEKPSQGSLPIQKNRGFIIAWLISSIGISIVLIGFGYMEKNRLQAKMDGEVLRVSLLQGNINQDQKWSEDFLNENFAIYRRLSERVAKSKPDVIVWPESAATCYITAPARRKYLYEVLSIYSEVQIPLMIGSLDHQFLEDREFLAYNSIFYFDNINWRKKLPRYHKNRLVPFAEWIPLSDIYPVMKKLKFGQADFTPSRTIQFFDHPKGKIGGFICFETVFPRYTRRIVNSSSDQKCFLINVTNDAWFGRTSAPYQHARMMSFRAIETRTSIGRAANTGISLVYNPLGELEMDTGIFHEAAITGELYPTLETSFYLKHGDIFDQVVFVLTLGWLIVILIPFKPKGDSGSGFNVHGSELKTEIYANLSKVIP